MRKIRIACFLATVLVVGTSGCRSTGGPWYSPMSYRPVNPWSSDSMAGAPATNADPSSNFPPAPDFTQQEQYGEGTYNFGSEPDAYAYGDPSSPQEGPYGSVAQRDSYGSQFETEYGGMDALSTQQAPATDPYYGTTQQASATDPYYGTTQQAAATDPYYGTTQQAPASDPYYGTTQQASATDPYYGTTQQAPASDPYYGTTQQASATDPYYGTTQQAPATDPYYGTTQQPPASNPYGY